MNDMIVYKNYLKKKYFSFVKQLTKKYNLC